MGDGTVKILQHARRRSPTADAAAAGSEYGRSKRAGAPLVRPTPRRDTR